MPKSPISTKATPINFPHESSPGLEPAPQWPNWFDRILNGVNDLIKNWALCQIRRRNTLRIEDMTDSQRADIGLAPHKYGRDMRNHRYLARF
ncbi:hypothetical protein [Thalassospira sp. TSL5-1]|uniref:hypothetical protein n=1 Tax=Thalassospira sp. TSL5-1 TaxID=1544451 RepID=UPI00093F7C3A|nr:hypothetical protein [Thalassospira sp. TSL5-1]OKH86937.1 hypothetical protein LF95_18160 [Thalassospira sp. TSL5-1]